MSLLAPAESEPDTPPPAAPENRRDLFWSFTWLALQGFGGVLAVVQRELVEKKRWLTQEQFVEDWAVAQVMPGPNVVNLSLMIGGRHFGWTGALTALAGMLTAPLLLLLLVAALYGSVADTAVAQGALRGMGAVAAALITATGLKLIAALHRNPMGMGVCIGLAGLTFVAIALLRWPLAGVLAVVGGGACLWAWRQLAPLATAAGGRP